MRTILTAVVGAFLLVGCASSQSQLYIKTSHPADQGWRPSGAPLRSDLCVRVAVSLSGQNRVDRNGVWYTTSATCQEVR
jgi:hypothetical protein